MLEKQAKREKRWLADSHRAATPSVRQPKHKANGHRDPASRQRSQRRQQRRRRTATQQRHWLEATAAVCGCDRWSPGTHGHRYGTRRFRTQTQATLAFLCVHKTQHSEMRRQITVSALLSVSGRSKGGSGDSSASAEHTSRQQQLQ